MGKGLDNLIMSFRGVRTQITEMIPSHMGTLRTGGILKQNSVRRQLIPFCSLVILLRTRCPLTKRRIVRPFFCIHRGTLENTLDPPVAGINILGPVSSLAGLGTRGFLAPPIHLGKTLFSSIQPERVTVSKNDWTNQRTMPGLLSWPCVAMDPGRFAVVLDGSKAHVMVRVRNKAESLGIG
jgi:hypothetical protein